MEWWFAFKDWFMKLGQNYGVNPLIFGAIYVGTIPLFTLSMGWVIKNIRRKKSILFPLMLSGVFFISAYIYLIVVGKNIPYWVYFFIVAMVILGLAGTIKKMSRSN